jgi:hypothetical protein
MAVDIARILKVSTSIQVPKRIKNAIDLYKKNRNQLCQEEIKTELKHILQIIKHSYYWIQGRIF